MRMQLTTGLCSAAIVALTLAAPPARAAGPIDAHVAGEVAVYGDTNAVDVVTSSLAARVDDPLRGWSTSGSYLVDFVSAASVDVVSLASGRFHEVRHAGGLSAKYQPDRVGLEVSGSVSREPDYLALGAGGVVSVELRDRTVTPMLGYAYGHEKAGRVGTPFSVYSIGFDRHTLSAGVELVLDPRTMLTLTESVVLEQGDQSKPYRLLPLFAPGVSERIQPGTSISAVNAARLPGRIAERLPGLRRRSATSVRLARRLGGTTLSLDERLYADDWGLLASTTDLRAVVDVGARLEVTGELRGHVQSSVSFWRRAYSAVLTDDALQAPAYRTGDRELSGLHTGTAGAGVRAYLTPKTHEPRLSIGVRADVWLTFFHDALYLRDRWAYLDSLDVTLDF